MENPRVRLFIAGCFGCDHKLKVPIQVGGFHFFCLGFIESVGDDMNPILLFEVIEDFFGIGKNVRLGGSSVHEVLFKHCRYGFGISPGMGKDPWKSLFPQVVLINFSYVIPIPKLEVDRMEGFEEFFKSWDSQVLKAVNLVEFRERFGDISIVVPQGVVEIEEEVLVRFQNGFSVGIDCFGSC